MKLRRVSHNFAGSNPAFIKPSDKKRAQPSERRIHLWVMGNIIGIILALMVIWMLTK